MKTFPLIIGLIVAPFTMASAFANEQNNQAADGLAIAGVSAVAFVQNAEEAEALKKAHGREVSMARGELDILYAEKKALVRKGQPVLQQEVDSLKSQLKADEAADRLKGEYGDYMGRYEEIDRLEHEMIKRSRTDAEFVKNELKIKEQHKYLEELQSSNGKMNPKYKAPIRKAGIRAAAAATSGVAALGYAAGSYFINHGEKIEHGEPVAEELKTTDSVSAELAD